MPSIILACATKPEWAPLAPTIKLGENLHLVQTGIGPERALQTFTKFLAGKNSSDLKVIHFGLSGALAPNLNPGDVIVPSFFISENHSPLFNHSHSLTTHLLTHLGLPFTTGTLFTSSTVLETPEKKSAAGEKFNAIAVDMETYPLAELCGALKIPFVSIRAIFDPAEWNLTDLGSDTLTPQGDIALAGLGKSILKNPKLLFKIPRYAQASKLATSKLTEFVLHALDRL